MAKKINNKDFIEEGFGKPLIDFFQMLNDEIDLSKKNLKDLAKELKKEVNKNPLNSGADVKELDKQKEQTETIKRLFKEQQEARKELAKIAEREAKKEAQIEAARRKEITRTAEFEKREKIKLANDLIRERKKREAELKKVAEREAREQLMRARKSEAELKRVAEREARAQLNRIERREALDRRVRSERERENKREAARRAANARAADKIAQREKRAAEKKLLRQKQLIERNKTEAGSIAQLRQQLRLTTRAYDQLSASERRNEEVGGSLLRTLRRQRLELGNIEAATGRHQRNVGNYNGSLGGLNSTLNKSIGRLGAMGAAVAAGFRLFGAVGNAVGAAARKVIEFNQSVANVKAVTGATEEDFQALIKSARELGASTQFSAIEVSKLQLEYAKLGFSTTEILNASEATLQLATATGSDLAESATVAASTIRAFGLNATDTQMVVDVMAKSFTSSALDLEKFKESMKLVAPIAKTTETSLFDASSALSVLADRGISGSLAGTQLRKIMSDLATKTGKSFQESLLITEQRLAGANTSAEKLAIAKELVGERAKGSLIALAENRKEVIRLSKAYKDSEGAAQAMANVVGDTLEGDVKRLSSAWDDLILNIGDRGTDLFRGAIQEANEFVTILGDLTRNTHAESDALQDQRLELNALVGQLTSANEGTDKRKGLLNELNAKYPKFLKNLDQENLSNEVLQKRLKEVNKQLLDQIKIKIENEKLDEKRRDLAKLERESFDDERKAFKAIEELNTRYGLSLEFTNETLGERISLTEKSVLALDKDKTSAIERAAAFVALELLQSNYTDSLKETEQARKDLTAAEETSKEFLKGIDQTKVNEDILGAEEAKKKAAEEAAAAAKAAAAAAAEEAELKVGLLEKIDEQTKKLREEQEKSTSPERILQIEKEIELLNKKRDALLGNTKAQDKLNKATKKEEDNSLKEFEKAAKNDADRLKKEVANREKAEKEKRKAIQKTIDDSFAAGEKFLEKQNDLALKAADDRVDKSAAQVDRLTTLAASGNKEAAKSLAAEAANQRKLEAEREKTIKRQTAQAALLAGLELTISASRRGDAQPAQTAAAQLGTISEAGSSFNQVTNAVGFFTGAERVSEDLASNKFYDGKDGYNINVHGTERILTGAQNAPLDGLSNEELSKAGVIYKRGGFDAHKYASETLLVERRTSSNNDALIKEVKDLKKAYKEGQKGSKFEYDPIRKSLREDVKQQGRLLSKHYKKGRLL